MGTILAIWSGVIAIIAIALIVDLCRKKRIKEHKAHPLVEIGTESEDLFITVDPLPEMPEVNERE